MKISRSQNLIILFSRRAIPGIACFLFLSACTTFDRSVRREYSNLPIEIADPGTMRIVRSHAHETSERLYVAGNVQPATATVGAHVHVELIDADGQILGEISDALIRPGHPRRSNAQSQRDQFVASFPLDEARRAVRIRVTAHHKKHHHS